MRTMEKLMLAVMLLCATSISAQQTSEEASQRRIKEEGKTIFDPYFFMQVQGGVAHTIGEGDFGDLLSPAAALSVGYKFNPWFGLRAGLSGWQAKGAWASPYTTYKYNYLQGNVDAMFDLCNLFGKFKARRVVNPYLFVGIGVNGAFNNDEAVALSAKGYNMANLWNDSKVFVAGRLGLGLDFRLCDNLSFNIEANGNMLSDKFNSKKAGNPDWQFNLLAGFTIKFGKGYKKTAPVYYEPEPQAAPAPVEEKKEEAPVVVEKEEPVVVEPIRKDIFFELNSAKIRPAELQKVDELAKFMNENKDFKVVICGYADIKTGNKNVNLRLSKERAEATATALKDKGIAEDRIQVEYKGDSEQPFSVNDENRVAICVTQQ